jgi:hypothetical protein
MTLHLETPKDFVMKKHRIGPPLPPIDTKKKKKKNLISSLVKELHMDMLVGESCICCHHGLHQNFHPLKYLLFCCHVFYSISAIGLITPAKEEGPNE